MESAEGALPTSSLSENLEDSTGVVDEPNEHRTGVEGNVGDAQTGANVAPQEVDTGADESARARSLSVSAIHKHYCKDLLEAANNLQSICNVQDTSITLIEYKEKVLVELRESYQMEDILDEAQRYYDKLAGLKKEMAALSKKSKDLARRAAYVKSVREKEKAKKEQERQRLARIEQDLAPRYSSDLT